MNWRRFNGEPINLPIKDQVRETIESEIANNNKLTVYITKKPLSNQGLFCNYFANMGKYLLFYLYNFL